MWDSCLQGITIPAKIQKLANDEWGVRTARQKEGRKTCFAPPRRLLNFYPIPSMPASRFEYPTGSGTRVSGQARAMIPASTPPPPPSSRG